MPDKFPTPDLKEDQETAAFRKEYEERRALITTPDEELIRYARHSGGDYSDSTIFTLTEALCEDTFDEKTKSRNEGRKLKDVMQKCHGKPMIDVGCGKDGYHHEM